MKGIHLGLWVRYRPDQGAMALVNYLFFHYGGSCPELVGEA